MSKRQTKKRPLAKYSIGDMRERIKLYQRDISSPVFNSAKFTETYTLKCERWAMVITKTGKVDFSAVNVNTPSTHEFTIRHLSGITTENRIKWNDNHYEILNIVNPDERSEFLVFKCKVLGDSDLEANQ